MRLREWRRPLRTILLGLCIMLGSVPVAGALDLDGVKITPSIGYKGEYDDNVFRTRTDRKGDYANYAIPAIRFEANPGRHSMSADFRAEVIRWSKNNNLDTERWFGDLLGDWKFNRLETWAKESFRWTDDFPSSELTQRIRRFENDLGGGFDYDIVPQRWGVGFDFLWNNKNYLESANDFLDQDTFNYAVNGFYRLTAKSKAFLEYTFVDEDYKNANTRNNTRHRGQVGLKGDITERFSVTGKAGWEHTNFHDGSLADQDNFVTTIDMSYRPLERLGLSLMLKRDQPASTYGTNAIYSSYSSTFLATYQFTSKFTLIPRVTFGVDNYQNVAAGETEKRLDYLYGGGLGLRYEVMKWLRLEASYDFSARNSNFDIFDYRDNKVNFTVTFSM